MAKVISLSESDLTRIVKRVIKEQEQIELASEVVISPKLNKLIDKSLESLSFKEMDNIQNSLNSIGINSGTSPITAISIADDLYDSNYSDSSSEMTEGDEELSVKDKIMNGVYASLGIVGALNLAFLNVPIAYLINSVLPEISFFGLDNQISFVTGMLLLILANRIKLKKSN
jgi:hypothetical protein